MARRIIPSFSPPGARPVVRSLSPFEGHPVSFFGEVTVESGAERAVRAEALANRTPFHVEIREVRIAIGAVQVNTDGAFIDGTLGFAVSLDVDGVPITKGYVPVALLTRVEDRSTAVQMQFASATEFEAFAQTTWRLSQPLFLKRGSRVNCSFRSLGATQYPFVASICLAGQSVRSAPGTARVPYVAAHASQPFDLAAAVSTSSRTVVESNETDLANLTGKPLFVDRIVGRVAPLYPVAGSTYPTNPNLHEWEYDNFAMALKLRLSASNGDHVVREFTPMRSIFGYTGSLEIPHVLQPGEYYRAAFAIGGPDPVNDPMRDSPTTQYTYFTGQGMVSIVGWREVSL